MLRLFTWEENHLGLWFFSKADFLLGSARGLWGNTPVFVLLPLLGTHNPLQPISWLWIFQGWIRGFSIDLRSHWKKGRMLSSTPAFPKQILSFFGQFNTSNIVYPCSRYWAKVCKDVRCKTFLTPFISVVFFHRWSSFSFWYCRISCLLMFCPQILLLIIMHQSLLSVWDVASSLDLMDKVKKSRPFKDQVWARQTVSRYPACSLSDQISYLTLHSHIPQSRTFLPKLLYLKNSCHSLAVFT